jgi:hypothetical protein
MGERRDSCRLVVEGKVRERFCVEEVDVDGRIT